MGQVRSLKTGIKYKETPIGKIPVDWEVVKLGDICSVIGGSTPSTNNKKYWGGDILFATPTDITSLEGREISETKQSITLEGLNSCGCRLLPEGSILLTSRATLGACAINTKPMATNQGFANLVCNDRADKWYIFYTIGSLTKELERLGSGSTFKEVSKSSIRSLIFTLPPLKEQKKIAAILTTVDEAIEGTKQIIEKTKELKKGLMQKLFTEGIGHKKFKKTIIGKIPVDWETVELADVCDEIYRYPTYYNIDYIVPDNGVPEIRGELIKENGELSTDLSEYRYIAEETSLRFPRTILHEGDFVISVRGTLGKIGYISNRLKDANITANLMRISPNRKIVFPSWLKQYFLSKFFQNRLNESSAATTIKTIKAPELKAIKLQFPLLSEQKKIAKILDSIDERMVEDCNHKDQLELLKKGLMQLLLTGKLRVKS